ncbi:MAG: hypothetical protein WCG21_01700 [Eubacteriales bacterium]
MRKTIFETIEDMYDIKGELVQLQQIFYRIPALKYSTYENMISIHDFANLFFNQWSGAYTHIDIDTFVAKLNSDDFYSISNYDNLILFGEKKLETVAFGNAEFFYNIYIFCEEKVFECAKEHGDEVKEYYTDLFLKFKYNIGILLDHISARAINIGEHKYAIIPNDEAVSAVVEGTGDGGTRESILIYNHFSMRGNLDGKATILRKLFVDVDGTGERSEATEDFRFIVNRADIRHNNTDSKLGNVITSGMNNKEIEELYDMTYRLYIAGKLADEYIGNLKDKITYFKKKSKL